jgi:hypothetical protein
MRNVSNVTKNDFAMSNNISLVSLMLSLNLQKNNHVTNSQITYDN